MTITHEARGRLVVFLLACLGFVHGERSARGADAFAPPDTVPVPSLIGSEPRNAAMACARVGLLFSSIDVVTSEHPDGRIFAQSVRSGTAVPRGTTITVRVARAPAVRLVVVPNLVGMTADDARPAVVARGLRFEVEDVVAPDRPEGRIFAQEPAAGMPVGSGVTVRARRAIRAAATVPSVVGRTLAEASALVRSAGFVARIVEVEADQVAAGVVVGQSPQGGASVPSGSEVTLRVATRTSVDVPRLIGLSRDEAVAALTRRGLAARIYTRPAPGFPVATVFEQLPVPGVPVRPGATVAFGVVVIVEDALIDMTVPDVRGMFSPQAVAKIRANGYAAKVVEVMTAPPFGIVLSQDPAPGNRRLVPPGATITLRVSARISAIPTVAVPALIGLTGPRAEAALLAAGLESDGAILVDRDRDPHVVYSQSIVPGTLVLRGTSVSWRRNP